MKDESGARFSHLLNNKEMKVWWSGFFPKKNKQACSFIKEFRIGKRENLIGDFASKDPNGFKLKIDTELYDSIQESFLNPI